MSRRSFARSSRGSVGRLASIGPDGRAVAVIVAGTLLAIGAILLGGFLPEGRSLVGLLYPFAVLLPAIGAAIVLGAVYAVRTSELERDSPLIDGEPPEAGVTRADHRVARETEWILDSAASDWYRMRDGEYDEKLRRRLEEGAVRTLATKRGLERSAAREAVREGTWTDDPVAAAVLADDRRHPLSERLYAAIDPGAALERRLERTLAAIEAIDDGPHSRGSDDRSRPRLESEVSR